VSTVKIEDDDGFTTEWAWPEGRSLLANADWFAIIEAEHDRLRAEHHATQHPKVLP
jgi:hypothetical protein